MEYAEKIIESERFEKEPKRASKRLWIAFKVARTGNRVLEILAALLILAMLLYGGYSLWDTYQIYHNAFSDQELMEYKPAGREENSPTLQELQKINPDVCAWLTVDDTNIDYPVVQGETDMEYINKDVYGNFAYSGAIFLDSQNHPDFSDSYNLIYGHHMSNGAMFGDVAEFCSKKYFKDHKTGTLYLPDDSDRKITFFACIKASASDSQIYSPYAQTPETMKIFLKYVKDKAVQYREIEVDEKDQIVGFSTCAEADSNGRILLFGKLDDVD